MNTPLPDAPLAQAYADFWRWFARHERAFFRAVKEHTRITEDFFDQLSLALDAVKHGFFFQAGMADEHTAELDISAEGVMENIVFVEELVAAAPPLPGWKFLVLKPAATEGITIQMADYEFGTDTMSFYANDNAAYPDEIDLTVVHRDLTADNAATIRNGVLIFLDNYLGELAFATTIDQVQVMGPAEAQQALIPLEKLPAFLTWRQKEFVEKYDGLRRDTEHDQYAGFEAELENGNALVAIANTDLLEWDAKASHPWVLVVQVGYDGSPRQGMPDPATYELLDQLENELVAALPDAEGYLNVGRQTGNDSREIYFACRDFRKPAQVLYACQVRYQGKLAVSYEIYKDKYWQSFERFRGN